MQPAAKSTICWLCVSAIGVMSVACGQAGSPTVAPSSTGAASIQLGAASPTASMSGLTPADAGACFAGSSDRSCFSAAHVGPRAMLNAVILNVPTALAATVSGTTVTLTWSAPAPGTAFTTYIIEAGSSTGSSNLANFSTGNVATSYIATSVPPGSYFVRVRAGDTGGNTSPPSNEVLVIVSGAVTPSPTPCPTPSSLFNLVTGTTVTLTWSSYSGSAACAPGEYVIEVGSRPNISDLLVFPTGTGVNSFTANNVAPGQYFVRVRIRSNSGLSGPSNEVVVTVTGPTGSANIDVTGIWRGVAPDGLFTLDSLCGPRDYTLDMSLRQVGADIVSASSATRTPRSGVNGSSQCDRAVVYGVTGTVGANGAVSFSLSGIINCAGTFTASRGAGSCTGPLGLNATWSVNKVP